MSTVDGWKSKPLLEVLALTLDFRGRTPKKLGMEWGGGDIPALSANNVEMGRINFSKECYLGSDALYRKWMTRGDARIGDVVLTTEAPLGNVAQIPDGRRYILSQRAILLRANDAELCNDYLKHYLTSEFFQNLMRQQSSGTTATGIQRAKLETLPVKFPISKTEQTKIAEILSTMDRAIEQTEAFIAKQQRIKTGLMQDLLTRGIDEHGNRRSEETHQFKDSPLGRIPVEWDILPLGRIIEVIDCKHYTPAYAEEGIPVIRPRNIKDAGFDFSDLDYVTQKDYALLTDKHEPSEGDIVFSRNASFGIPVFVEDVGRFCIGQDVVIMTKKSVNPRFIFFALKSESTLRQIRNVSGGSTFGRIDLGAIRDLKIVFPISNEEQSQIAHHLLKCSESVGRTMAGLTKIRSLKTALMQDLLTGKKRVTPLLVPEATH